MCSCGNVQLQPDILEQQQVRAVYDFCYLGLQHSQLCCTQPVGPLAW